MSDGETVTTRVNHDYVEIPDDQVLLGFWVDQPTQDDIDIALDVHSRA